uniref:Secreted protein n=1 Tax=Hippocampus comes TaxID=109280 RepID=A0A3Q2YZL3_HIPCM
MCVCVWVCVCVCVCVVFVLRAPRTAVYKFVKCRPEGNRANCVTQQSPQMEWSPDLPTKLPPPSSAPYLSWRNQDKGAEREMQEDHFLQL